MSCIELIHLYENRVREQDELITEMLDNNETMLEMALAFFIFMILLTLAPFIYDYIKKLLK